jgi:glucokinase
MRTFLGIDFGATNCKYGILDIKGNLKYMKTHPIKDISIPGKFLDFISYIVEKNIKKYKIKAIGIGLPGQIDYRKGFIYNLTNIKGWENLEFRKLIKKKVNLPAFIDNDVNIATIGEKYKGAGIKYQNFIMVTLGTGVGGGIFLNNKLYRGRDYMGGEIGHIPLKPNGPKCKCGGIACLERYIGSKYIVKRAYRSLKKNKNSLLYEFYKREEEITPKIISDCAKKGDLLAIKIWEKMAVYLATTLAGIINFLNIEVIIIGGGVANAGKFLFEPLKKELKKRTLPISGKRIKILKSKLGNKAGVIGAGIFAKINI